MNDKNEYSEELLAGEDLAAMDALFNAWLATHNMVSHEGAIYMGTPTGEIKQVDGIPVNADPQLLIKMLNDGEFEQYVAEKNPHIHLTTRQNEFQASNEGASGES